MTLWYARKAVICTRLIQLHITTHVIGLPKIETYSIGLAMEGLVPYNGISYYCCTSYYRYTSSCGVVNCTVWREESLDWMKDCSDTSVGPISLQFWVQGWRRSVTVVYLLIPGTDSEGTVRTEDLPWAANAAPHWYCASSCWEGVFAKVSMPCVGM